MAKDIGDAESGKDPAKDMQPARRNPPDQQEAEVSRTGFHGIYNLLITADGGWKTAGYLFPSVLILCLFIAKILLPKFTISLK